MTGSGLELWWYRFRDQHRRRWFVCERGDLRVRFSRARWARIFGERMVEHTGCGGRIREL